MPVYSAKLSDSKIDLANINGDVRRYYSSVGLDNVVLSIDLEPYKTRASAAKTVYSSIKDEVMNTSVKGTLDDAKGDLDDFADDDAIASNVLGYVSAIKALETANENAQTSIDNFIILNNLIGNSKPAGYVAPEGVASAITGNSSLDPAAKAAEIRAAVITAGTANYNTDITAVIVNNSFELGSTLGWTTVASDDTGARGNASPYTTSGIDGSWQFNTWSKGTPITQTIGTLPAGRYKLAALVSSDGGTIYLKMNDTHSSGLLTSNGATYVNNEYTFTLASDTEVTIGAVGGAGDGNYTAAGHWWYKADKFTLTYIDDDPLGRAKVALTEEISNATDLYDSWTPKVGTTPFKYDATYYNALNTSIAAAQAVIDADDDEVGDYTDAKSALETAESNMASSTLNLPASDKYYRLYLAEDGVSTGKNLNMLKTGVGNAVLSESPYPVKFVKSGDNYIIENPYNYYVTTNRVNNSNWGTFIDLTEDDTSSIDESLKPTTMNVKANVWGIVPQEDGTFKMLNQQATWKGWGWYLGTWSSSEGAKVAAYDGSASPKNPSKTTWLCSEPVEVTNVNLAVNATTGWGTFIAPYENLIPSTVKAYTVSHKGSGYIYLEENETGVLSANTPYILSTEEASNVSVAFKGIADNDEDTYEDNGLVGLLAAKTVPANSYILQYQAGKVGTAFYKLENNLTGTKYRCYLDLENVPASSSSRASVSMGIFDDETTGIRSIDNGKLTIDNYVYDLRGQRVAQPTKGLYIVNGKKVVIK